jgi:hypothetical protein
MRPNVLLQQDGFKVLLLGNGPDQDVMALGRAGSSDGLQYVTNNSLGQYGGDGVNTADGFVLDEAAVFSVLQESGTEDQPTSAELAKNGVLLSGDNVYVPPVTSRNLNYIGKSYWPGDGWLQGDIAEVLIYNRKVTQDEDEAINIYLTTKYGL